MQLKNPILIHTAGILLFLFIPLVLFLFLRFPLGILSSMAVAVGIIPVHRLVARPFFLHHKMLRCFWCGKISAPRTTLSVMSGSEVTIEVCQNSCIHLTARFFNFCERNKAWIGAGIFLPLLWYVITMVLMGFHLFFIPIEWNRFVFQFFIACTVVAISFAYRMGKEETALRFTFPIHNLFLLGAKNTLLVFRYVGIWWIAASLLFLYHQF